MRWWCSWICTADDYRPVTFPPNAAVLGWWCSGSDAGNSAILCALVEADTRDELTRMIRKDWPEFSDPPVSVGQDGGYRILETVPDDFVPSDRYVLTDWQRERLAR